MLPIRRLIRVLLISRLPLVQELMPLQAQQLISDTRTTLVDTVTSMQGSDGGVIAASGVHEYLIKIHDIQDSAVFKWVGNTAFVLAHPFNSCREHCKV